jgi:hypothetical protein
MTLFARERGTLDLSNGSPIRTVVFPINNPDNYQIKRK